jgi:ComF family protein
MLMKNVFHDLVDLVFPHCCPGCDEPFVSGEDNLCTSCELDMPYFDADEDIMHYFAGRIDLENARAFLKFYNQGITQKLLHHIKYKGDQNLAEHLGKMFIHHLEKAKVLDKIDLVVPVPLHPSKQKVRGYNQSEALARGIGEALGVPVEHDSLIRTKKSETQTQKTRAERWQNVSEIFKVTDNKLKDKNVLLVDDVVTTGATLEACGETILAAGAASLSVAAIAAAM